MVCMYSNSAVVPVHIINMSSMNLSMYGCGWG